MPKHAHMKAIKRPSPPIRFFNLSLAVVLTVSCAAASQAQGTSSTYQGKLTDTASPANGLYDLTFTLFNGDGAQA